MLDFAVVDGTLLALLLWQPSLGLSFFVLVLAVQACIHYLNLAAHLDTDAADRAALGVTSTSPFYSRYFFNAGYHQAHHLKPQVPWRALPALTQELLQKGLHRPSLQLAPAPIHPAWVARVAAARRASAAPSEPASLPETSVTPS